MEKLSNLTLMDLALTSKDTEWCKNIVVIADLKHDIFIVEEIKKLIGHISNAIDNKDDLRAVVMLKKLENLYSRINMELKEEISPEIEMLNEKIDNYNRKS